MPPPLGAVSWQAVPTGALTEAWLRAFSVWLATAAGRSPPSTPSERRALRLLEVPAATWPTDPAFLALLVTFSAAVVAAPVTRPVLLSLARLREVALHRLCPASHSSRRREAVHLELLFHVSGWMLLLLGTRLQLSAGARRRSAGRRRAACLPSGLVAVLRDGGGPTARPVVAEWMLAQTMLFVGRPAFPEAVVYGFCAERSCYIGYAGPRRRSGAPGLRAPARAERLWGPPRERLWEHISDVLFERARSVNKAAHFRGELHGMLVGFVIGHGAVPAMQGLETALLRALRPPANSALAHQRGVAPPRACGASGPSPPPLGPPPPAGGAAGRGPPAHFDRLHSD